MSNHIRSPAMPSSLDERASGPLIDQFGRAIHYLRVSVTTACNLRCVYCRPAGNDPERSQGDLLTDDEVVHIVEAGASVGVTTVRLTGGEPLLRPNLSALVRRLSSVGGIREVSMTTNGLLLADRAHELATAGLRRVNISLDTLDANRYRRLAGSDALSRVLRAIDAALAAGLHPVKINAVIGLSPEWRQDVVALARLALERPLHVRFIELMPTGSTPWRPGPRADDVLSIIGGRWDPTADPGPPGSGPAAYLRLDGAPGLIGLIAPMSAPFCSTCNRLRLSARGRLHPCLFSDTSIDVRSALQSQGAERQERLRRAFRQATLCKPRSHGPGVGEPACEMAEVGG